MIWIFSIPKCYTCGYGGLETSRELLEKTKRTLNNYTSNYLRNPRGQRKKICSLWWKNRPITDFLQLEAWRLAILLHLLFCSRYLHSCLIHITYFPPTYFTIYINIYNCFWWSDLCILPVFFWWNSLRTPNFSRLFSACSNDHMLCALILVKKSHFNYSNLWAFLTAFCHRYFHIWQVVCLALFPSIVLMLRFF